MAKPGSLFLYQSYVESSDVPVGIRRETERLLQKIGYPATEVPRADEVVKMFLQAGFKLRMLIDLWPVYAADNRRMISLYHSNRRIMEDQFGKREVALVGELLSWEKVLFAEGYWTGLRVIARRVKLNKYV